MNRRDSEAIAGMMVDEGYSISDTPEEADVILINTCSVRQHAEERAISNMGALLKTKSEEQRAKSRKIYGIVGCSAQSLKQELFKRLPELDFIAGPSEISRIPKIIDEIRKKQKRVSALSQEKARPEKLYASSYTEDKKHAYVNISEGCDNYCSYCVVPYARGHLRHRKAENILKEIKKLVSLGVKDVMLLGQNVNSYESRAASHGLRVNFVDLLKMVNDIEGLENFSFVTSHPKDASIKLFEAMRDLPKLKKYLHLPIQSGSDRILRLMNRGYTSGRYRKLVSEYRKIVPQGSLATDIIVGFPGESDADFKATYDLLKAVKFNSAYIFKYSPRPNTKAAEMPDSVPKEVKEERHKILLDMQKNISRSLKSFLLIFLFTIFYSLFTIHCSYAASLKSAEKLFLESNYEAAIRDANEALNSARTMSRRSELKYLMAVCHLKINDLEKAEELFGELIEICTTFPICDKAILGMGDVYFAKGDYDKAAEFYLQIKNSESEFRPSALYKLIHTSFKKGDLAQGKAYIAELKKNFPKSAEAHMADALDTGDLFFTVQVGAFANKANAQKLADELSDKGFDAYVESFDKGITSLYRVRVGKFSSREEAEAVESRLSEQDYPTKIFP